MRSKLLKVKKWIDLNDAAERLSISLEENVTALDLMDLCLDKEITLSVRFPYKEKYVIREIQERTEPYIEHLERLFQMELVGRFHSLEAEPKKGSEAYNNLYEKFIDSRYLDYKKKIDSLDTSVEKTSKEFFLNNTTYSYWGHCGDVKEMDGNIYELPMIGSEVIDVSNLIEINKEHEIGEFYNLDGVFIRDAGGILYNLMERFSDEILSKWDNDLDVSYKDFHLNNNHYFPTGQLPAGCELGITPANLSDFESKISENENSVSVEQVLTLLGVVLEEVTGKAKKWTQGDLSSCIDQKGIKNLKERTVNGLFSLANKSLKSNR